MHKLLGLSPSISFLVPRRRTLHELEHSPDREKSSSAKALKDMRHELSDLRQAVQSNGHSRPRSRLTQGHRVFSKNQRQTPHD